MRWVLLQFCTSWRRIWPISHALWLSCEHHTVQTKLGWKIEASFQLRLSRLLRNFLLFFSFFFSETRLATVNIYKRKLPDESQGFCELKNFHVQGDGYIGAVKPWKLWSARSRNFKFQAKISHKLRNMNFNIYFERLRSLLILTICNLRLMLYTILLTRFSTLSIEFMQNRYIRLDVYFFVNTKNCEITNWSFLEGRYFLKYHRFVILFWYVTLAITITC